MPVFDLEYTICQIQSGQFSMAAKSHREEGGTPTLSIVMRDSDVEWRLDDLEHGIAETVGGAPRVNRVDFYFRIEVLRDAFPRFPAARCRSNSAAHRFHSTNPSGQERPGGIDVRMVYPHCRFFPVSNVDLFSRRAPAFHAHANDATLHLDMETGPARIYGHDIFEVHFGIEANYELQPIAEGGDSYVVMLMSDVVYATIRAELATVL